MFIKIRDADIFITRALQCYQAYVMPGTHGVVSAELLEQLSHLFCVRKLAGPPNLDILASIFGFIYG